MDNIQKPIVLSIAGFDPSGGAGVLADIKTFENIGVYGIGVITSHTLQTEKVFENIKWRNTSVILKELEFLLKHYPVQFAKTGIVKNIEMLQDIVFLLHKKRIKIIWDSILSTSTNKKIFDKKNLSQMSDVIDKIYCITPNFQEALILSGKDNVNDAGNYLSKYTNMIIKGGHNELNKGVDFLFEYKSNPFKAIYPQTQLNIYPKHGSGCVFSSALTAFLSLNNSLIHSAILAKKYTEQFLASNLNLIGFHHHINI